jgi:hypothetical protein
MSPIERDALPQALIRDPVDERADASHPPRLVAFVGLAGDSDHPNSVRLYLDEELRQWFDVEEAKVVYSERRNVSVGTRTVLWVDERTTLQVRQAQPQDIHGEYLTGKVAAVTVPQTAAFVALDVSYIKRTIDKFVTNPCPCSPDTTDASQS